MPALTASAESLAAEAAHHAAGLTDPAPCPDGEPWAGQLLATGSAGIALAHIERARSSLDDWRRAHTFIQDAIANPVSTHDGSGLYLGAPAVAFMLDAAAGTTGRYQRGLADLDSPVADLAHRRAAAALERVAAAAPTAFAEYDVFYGLAGIAALLLRRDPGGSAMEHALTALVALTRPLSLDGREVPGWWCSHDPHRGHTGEAGGHANFGLAHGITGPLALLSRAARGHVVVDGQYEAITTICAWLDRWRQEGPAGPWWPEHITVGDLAAGRPSQAGPTRPGWCYGTPGIARAGQLAAIATGDRHMQEEYEDALAACLDDPAQQARITDAGLCHGAAGLFQTVWRAAADDSSDRLRLRLPPLAERLAAAATSHDGTDLGLLTGTAGLTLALHTAATDTAPNSGWDTCLLID
jgi:hypothetical protein